MQTQTLAVVVPIDTAEESDEAIRETVWRKTTELLLPKLGKLYTRFEPAAAAWRQTIRQPYGVVIGRSEPAMFLYFFEAAKTEQETAILYHLDSALEGMDISKTKEGGRMLFCSVNIDPNDHDTSLHLLWHISFLSGELLPDCCLYFQQEKQGFATGILAEETLSQMERYALCMVTLITED